MAKTKKASTPKKKTKSSKAFVYIVFTFIFSAIIAGSSVWYVVFKPNVKLSKHKQFIYIYSTDTYEDVEESLKPLLKSMQTFKWVSAYMGYPNKVKPGRYTLADEMTNKQLVSLLRSGKQEPVKLVIRTYSLIEDIAHVVSKNLETDSVAFLQKLTDRAKLSSAGVDDQSSMSFILPNTYYLNWNSNPDTIINKLYREYIKFWTPEREHQAALQGLTKGQAVILASIVWREIMHADEMPRVAGVYLKRLRKDMLLQADPTVKYALKEFDLRRILQVHLEAESPFNTYKNKGLPPGPICNPPAAAIDAVLNPEEHEYIYFCAQPGNTGYHSFAINLQEHNKNASLFHKYLNSLRKR